MAKDKYGVLEATFAYAKIAQADTKYQSKDTEYVVDCIVDKAVAKAWNKEFPKQKAKELEKDEFEAKYKMDSPVDGDEVYVIKLKKAASKDGEVYDEKYRPRVLLDTADGERLDITTSRLISNGSVGKASYRIIENDFGKFAQLNNILMDESGFIEYASSGGAGSEFGGSKPIKVEASKDSVTKARKPKDDVENPSHPLDSKGNPDDEPAKPAAKPVKPSKPKAPVEDIDEDETLPF